MISALIAAIITALALGAATGAKDKMPCKSLDGCPTKVERRP